MGKIGDDERGFFSEGWIEPPPKTAAVEKPHYLGHRDRLRERFTAGPVSCPTTNFSSFCCSA
jgi:DNA repair protein RadC